jgi:hypothetical protein
MPSPRRSNAILACELPNTGRMLQILLGEFIDERLLPWFSQGRTLRGSMGRLPGGPGVVVALLLLLTALLAVGSAAQGATVFTDNFDASISGLNVTPTGWTVTDGTVDVVGGGLCVGGLCVDLDGSTSNAGVLSHSFALTGGVTYTAAFDLSGSQRGSNDDVTILFGTSSLVLSVLSGDPYASHSLNFTPAVSGSFDLSFSNAGGDNLGALLDNVEITTAEAAVPEPQTYVLIGLGLLTLAPTRQRRAS